MTHPTHSDAYQPITGTQFSHTPACIWTWVVLMCIELSCEARQHPRGCSSVGRALRSHRRGRGFDYHQLHEGRFHSTGIGLFHFSPPMTIRPRCGGCRAQRDWGGVWSRYGKDRPHGKDHPQSAFSRHPRQREEDSATAGGSGAEALADEAFSASAVMPAKPSMEAHCGPSALALRLKPSWAMVVAPDATAEAMPVAESSKATHLAMPGSAAAPSAPATPVSMPSIFAAARYGAGSAYAAGHRHRRRIRRTRRPAHGQSRSERACAAMS